MAENFFRAIIPGFYPETSRPVAVGKTTDGNSETEAAAAGIEKFVAAMNTGG